jgi:hypothetical protein
VITGMAKFAKNHQTLSRIKVRCETDEFLKIADNNEYTGRMSAFCMPRFRRNV